jgi:hypothetical protein
MELLCLWEGFRPNGPELSPAAHAATPQYRAGTRPGDGGHVDRMSLLLAGDESDRLSATVLLTRVSRRIHAGAAGVGVGPLTMDKR